MKRLWLLAVMLPFLLFLPPQKGQGERQPRPWGDLRDGERDRDSGDVWAKGVER